MNIQIPSRLSRRLSENTHEQLKVMQLFQSIDILLQAHLDFFPDYTNHGIPHVQKVLELADQLIPDDSLKKLRPEDVCYLVCAITIHDLGMFLSVDGVLELITGQRKDQKTRYLDRYAWCEAWEAYRSESRRFSDEKMLECFGEKIDIANICMATSDMKRSDYLVIGEFLRRYHPRLAHDIALNGFPGSTIISILPENQFPKRHRDLIGLLGRSHGMALRDSEQYLSKQFADERMPCGCPAFYLMAVLRIADLLDAGKHRAPEILQERQAIYIPISHQEWRWNQKVDMSDYFWDVEHDRLSIEGSPESSTEFVLLKNWINHIQQELDMCWSVISEKYGAKYALSIHRVKSTILDPDNEAYHDEFLAKEAKLQANPELLKLLISPLYANDPSYGVRELIQNAVDACIEREHLEHKRGNPDYKGHIIVRLDTTAKTFTIEDNGIGMNEDVLLNYYLAAGSSYRYSENWARDFAPDKHPEIARTGKFGVGVLATFLLGDHVTVSTQHIDDSLGYQFEFDVEPKQLDIIRRHRASGTTITVQLTDNAIADLEEPSGISWNEWYVFDDPIVDYYINDVPLTRESETIYRNAKRNTDWFELHSDIFKSYLWKYGAGTPVCCNGIQIPDIKDTDFHQFGLKITRPRVSLIDPSAQLNVDLARDYVTSFPEKQKLARMIYQQFLAQLLLTNWDTPRSIENNLLLGFNYPGGTIPFLQSSSGFMLNHPSVLSVAKLDRYITLFRDTYSFSNAANEAFRFLPADMPVWIIPADAMADSSDSIFGTSPRLRRLERFGALFFLDYDERIEYRPIIINTWLRSAAYTYLGSKLHRHLPLAHAATSNTIYKWESSSGHPLLSLQRFCENTAINMYLANHPSDILASYIQNEWDSIDFLPDPDEFNKIIKQIQAPYTKYKFPINETLFDESHFPFVLDCAVPDITLSHESLLSEVIREFLVPHPNYPKQDIWIPYDLEERKKKFPKAFTELAYFMECIRKEK